MVIPKSGGCRMWIEPNTRSIEVVDENIISRMVMYISGGWISILDDSNLIIFVNTIVILFTNIL